VQSAFAHSKVCLAIWIFTFKYLAREIVAVFRTGGDVLSYCGIKGRAFMLFSYFTFFAALGSLPAVHP